jgi:CPA2 family monovalent cation:H+ antiporter-2
METTHLLVTLIVALGAALVGGAIAVRLGQSVIIGYILAGALIGPFTPGFVADVAMVQVLADIGVILVMFAVGVQLSIRELLRTGPLALAGGVLQVLGVLGAGYLLASTVGWMPLEALLLGGVAAISSTTVLAKMLADHGETESTHGRLTLGWAAVQDLSTIVMVVVFSAIGTDSSRVGESVAFAGGKAVLFLVVIALVGSRALPWFFEWVLSLRNREVFVLTVAVVALGIAYLSSWFGLSFALGAFVAGLVVSESDVSHQILGELLPLRDIFAGLFFVSIGMLFDPGVVLSNPLLLLALVTLIVLVKGLFVAVPAAVGGASMRTAILGAALLGQAGEFSFLLARVGIELGVLRQEFFSLMLAGSAATVLFSAPIYAGGRALARWAEGRFPPSDTEALGPGVSERAIRGHAVICGYGRVGRIIAAALRRRGFRFVVIDQDRDVVRGLREKGVLALLGNAANPVLLDRVALDQARVLVVAIPDPLAARQTVEFARQANRRLDIVVRTHNAAEMKFMRERGVGEAVMGELELALEMTRHTLHRFGVTGAETLATLQGLREHIVVDEGLDAWEVEE